MEHTTAGTQLKLLVDLKVESTQVAMTDYDFVARFFTYRNRYVDVPKEAMIETDDGCYIAIVDTTALGEGEIQCEVEAHLPDSDAMGGYRVERATLRTGIHLRRSIYELS